MRSPENPSLPTYALDFAKAASLSSLILFIAGTAGLVSGNESLSQLLKFGLWAMFASIMGAVFHQVFDVPVTKRLKREHLAWWNFTRLDQARHSRVPVSRRWQVIPRWFIWGAASCVAIVPVVGILTNLPTWILLLIATIGFASVSAMMILVGPNESWMTSDRFVECAVLGNEYAYWRKRLIRYFPFSDTKPMRIEKRNDVYFFVAVSRTTSKRTVDYEFWIPIPPAELGNARETLSSIRDLHRNRATLQA